MNRRVQLLYKSEDIGVNEFKAVADHFDTPEQAMQDVTSFAARNGCLLIEDYEVRTEGSITVYDTELHSCSLQRSRLDLRFRILVFNQD